MKYFVLLGVLLSVSVPAQAIECANGVYRAGCVGPNGAAGVRKPVYRGAPASVYHPYHAPQRGGCASGPYRAGCAGPNGAVIVR